MNNLEIILVALLALSEALALIPAVKGSKWLRRSNGLLHGLKELVAKSGDTE